MEKMIQRDHGTCGITCCFKKAINISTPYISRLTPILPNNYARIFIIFDTPMCVSRIRIYNYRKTPQRGVRYITVWRYYWLHKSYNKIDICRWLYNQEWRNPNEYFQQNRNSWPWFQQTKLVNCIHLLLHQKRFIEQRCTFSIKIS